MKKIRRNVILDIEKAIAAYMVVFIHVIFPSKMGVLFDVLARFAVPLFFIISGYFCYYSKSNINKYKNKIYKLMKLLFVSIIIYYIWNSCMSKYNFNTSSDLIYSFINIKNIIKLILFNVSQISEHLWFLYALIYCYIIFIYIDRFNLYIISYKMIPIIIVIHLLLGEGLGILGLKLPIFLVRNFIFMGLPFFMLGNFIHFYEDTLCNYFSNKKLIMGIFIGLSLSVIERIIGGKNELYIGSVIVASSSFLYAIKNSNYEKTCFLNKIGERYSLFIYLFHYIIIDIVKKFSSMFKLEKSIVFNYFKPILVCIIISICAMIFYKVRDIKYVYKLKLKGLKKEY